MADEALMSGARGHAGLSAGGAALASGPAGPAALAGLIPVALDGLARGAAERQGPAPSGGPAAVAAAIPAALPDAAGFLPLKGVGAERALGEYARLLAAGSVDPADPWCAAHLHCPPLAVAVAADVVAGALNPSMDSWDQAPVAGELERELTTGMARLCYPDEPAPDAVVTTGGSESNLLGLLLAREHAPGVRPVCAASAHHSVARAAWLLGTAAPVVVDDLTAEALSGVLAGFDGPAVVLATAGTTDTGDIDPLRALAGVCRSFGARLHVDAAYGGPALCSERLRPLLDGLELADSVALDLHKFGWQPVAAGLFACRDGDDLGALAFRAEYLNAADDTEAGLPDLLGRSIRTSRRPDGFRMAVTFRALGTEGVGELVERCCATAACVAADIGAHPLLRLRSAPVLSTVVFRPLAADRLPWAEGDALVARVRRRLLEEGAAVLGRATLPDRPGGAPRVWLKLTLLHPHATAASYRGLLELVARAAEAAE